MVLKSTKECIHKLNDLTQVKVQFTCDEATKENKFKGTTLNWY